MSENPKAKDPDLSPPKQDTDNIVQVQVFPVPWKGLTSFLPPSAESFPSLNSTLFEGFNCYRESGLKFYTTFKFIKLTTKHFQLHLSTISTSRDSAFKFINSACGSYKFKHHIFYMQLTNCLQCTPCRYENWYLSIHLTSKHPWVCARIFFYFLFWKVTIFPS